MSPNNPQMRLPGSVAEIEASPEGPEVGAFFDLDGTLVAGFTGVVMTQDRLRRRQMSVGEFIGMVQAGLNHQLGRSEFAGACEYLLREERDARRAVDRATLTERATQARDFGVSSRSLSLADALRILAWVRWASSAEVDGFPTSARVADAALTTLDIRGTMGEEHAAMQRADAIRSVLIK